MSNHRGGWGETGSVYKVKLGRESGRPPTTAHVPPACNPWLQCTLYGVRARGRSPGPRVAVLGDTCASARLTSAGARLHDGVRYGIHVERIDHDPQPSPCLALAQFPH
eukprot:6758538-Prymnesium_polylepis.1